MAEFLVPNNFQQIFSIRPLRNHKRSNCADTIVTQTFKAGTFYDSIQFPVVRIPNINDVRVLLSSPKGAQVVKNKRVTYYVTCENVGSNPVDGKVKLDKNPKFSDQKFEPAGVELNANTYEWSYTQLQPGQKRTFVYNALADDTIFSDDLQFQASASTVR